MNIEPRDPLSQVVFVHDYFQLVFQAEILSVFNEASVQVAGATHTRGEARFPGALVELIGQRATAAPVGPSDLLALMFASGAQLRVHSQHTTLATLEAFTFTGEDGKLVVEHNP